MLTAALWAISPILMKKGLKEGCPPNEVPAIRSIAFLLSMLVIFLYVRPASWPKLTPWLLLGLIVNVGSSTLFGDLLYVYAIDMIGASLAVTISCGYPLVTTLFSILLLGERITTMVWIGTLMIIGGLLLIRYDAARKNKQPPEYTLVDRDEKKRTMRGILLAAASAFLSGANMPLNKMLMVEGQWTPVESYFLRSVVFFALVWGTRIVQEYRFPNAIRPVRWVPLRAWLALLGGGIVALTFAGLLYGYCIQVLPVSAVTPITASSPFMTVVLSRIIFKEKLTNLQRGGVFLVIAGSISVSL